MNKTTTNQTTATTSSKIKKRYALDIETEPLPEYKHVEEAGLIPHMSRITVVAVSDGKDFNRTFRDLNELEEWVMEVRPALVGHNFKFDLKHLAFHGLALQEFWIDDTQLMAHVCTEKVSEEYLEAYEQRRVEENKKLAHGVSHRKAKGLSLKTLAPYFLDVPAFWETPDNHDNDEYALKDAAYTARLADFFEARLKQDGHWKFYRDKQMNWTRSLLKAELTGIMLNVDELIKRKAECEKQVVELEATLKTQWEGAIEEYETQQKQGIAEAYQKLAENAVARLKNKTKANQTRARYEVLAAKALHTVEPFNFDSPKQLTWLLKEQLGYNIKGWDGDEATDKEVLQRLAQDGHKDVARLLEYRKTRKLATTYYPTLLELMRPVTNKIHGTFEATGARTGRTSSNLPNLQNQPPVVRDLFIAEPGKLLVTRDVSALEPTLIAFYSEDRALTDIIKSGASFHSVNAKEIFKLDCTEDEVKKLYPKHRDAAKEFGLSVLYGAGANRVKQSLDKRGFSFTVDEARTFVNRLRDMYSGVWRFKKELDQEFERGTTIYNYMGRPIQFTDPEEVYMRAFNRLIQGSGSDIMQQALTDISAIPDCEVLLFVHDELVVQVPEAKVSELEAQIVREMTKFDLGEVKLGVEGATKKYWAK